MKGVCDNTLGNMLFLKDNAEMARRTLIVRYEDVAVEPFTYAAVSQPLDVSKDKTIFLANPKACWARIQG